MRSLCQHIQRRCVAPSLRLRTYSALVDTPAAAPAPEAAEAAPAAATSAGPNKNAKKRSLYDFTLPELEEAFVGLGMQRYRAKQTFISLYKHGVSSIKDIKNLSLEHRQNLEEQYGLHAGDVSLHSKSAEDATEKLLLNFQNANVETVFIPMVNDRGRAMPKQNLRNLTTAEIVSQVMQIKRSIGDFPDHRLVGNLVFMGMGEPAYNYRNVKKAIEIFTHGDGIGIGPKRITVSTSGVVPFIDRLAKDFKVVLAISLHAVTNELRDELVPINKTFPLKEVIDACRRYPHGRITFEYVMLRGVNDSVAEAKQLKRLLHGIPSHVNLIPFNPWPGSSYQPSHPEDVVAFQNVLYGLSHIKCTVRTPRGRDIMAACGQLATLPPALAEQQQLAQQQQQQQQQQQLAQQQQQQQQQ